MKELINLIYFALAIILLLLLLVVLSLFLVYQGPNKEKNSLYKCGFNPFQDARMKFEVKFYLVGIMYIIFDLEVLFLFLLYYLSNFLL